VPATEVARRAGHGVAVQPTGGEPPGRQRVYAQVQPFDGTWKVTTLVVEQVGTC
jgi:hypothetical protein